MSKLVTLAALSALTLAITGCTTGNGIDEAAITSAISTGLATYEQIQAIQAELDSEHGSLAAPEPCVTNCGAEVTEAEAADKPPVAVKPPVAPVVTRPEIVPASGKAVAVMLGNVATCSHCKKLAALNPEPYVETALPAVDWINADAITAPAAFAKYRPKTGFSYPLVRVFDAAGVFQGEFVARSMLLDAIVAKIKGICPSCATK